jgi:LDH2 family malate/lactate/ureidoglycolate dehydrogenase
MALDVSRWMPLDAYFDRLESLVEIIKASGLGREVLLPGEARWKAYAYNSVNGISIGAETRRLLSEFAEPLGIRAPWA